MKKLVSVLCFILLLSIMIAPLSEAAGDNYDTLVNWDIKIAVPDDTTAVLRGNEYYIYAQHEGSIPYVMLRVYGYDDAETFLSDFTTYMHQQYADLKVTAEAGRRTIGNKDCWETDYSYTVSGYTVTDRRIATVAGGQTYLFASKEIESNGMTIGNMLDEVVANCTFLSEPEPTKPQEERESGLAAGYLYCREDGMPKYWLDLTGVLSDHPVLHCYFRSGDPTFYESWFILDLSTAEMSGNAIRFYNVYDEYDFDHSNWFRQLTFQFYLDGAVMTVDRDERTLAGGAEDNILTGTYAMVPVGVGTEYRQLDQDLWMPDTYLMPEEEGPYTPAELGKWAQIYYFDRNGFFPPVADVEENPDGSYSIHLYENVSLDGIPHTATSAWYTVDAFGVGIDDIFGDAVNLMERK